MSLLAKFKAARWRVSGYLAVSALAAFVILTAGDLTVFRVGQVLTLFIALIGLDVLVGYAGLLSAGQGAMFGVGGYAAALLVLHSSTPWLPAVVAATAVSMVAGALLAVPAFRIRGFALAIVTIGVAIIVPAIAGSYSILGGYVGLTLPIVSVPFALNLTSTEWLVLVIGVFALGSAITTDWFLRTAHGRALHALRRDERLAASLGVDVRLAKVIAFALASGLGGLGGALNGELVGSVTPSTYSFNLSLYMIVAIVVGGLRSKLGALVGAAFITYVPTWTADIGSISADLVYAVVLIAVLFLMPTGIVGFLRGVVLAGAQLRRRRAPGVHDLGPVAAGAGQGP